MASSMSPMRTHARSLDSVIEIRQERSVVVTLSDHPARFEMSVTVSHPSIDCTGGTPGVASTRRARGPPKAWALRKTHVFCILYEYCNDSIVLRLHLCNTRCIVIVTSIYYSMYIEPTSFVEKT